MMNSLFLPCLVLALFLSASLASPVVVSESSSAVVANPASASPAVLNSAPAAVPNSESSSSVDLLPLPLPIPITAPNPISPALYDDFVLYTKYSSAAYQPFCARPVGRVLVRAVRVVCSLFPTLFSVRVAIRSIVLIVIRSSKSATRRASSRGTPRGSRSSSSSAGRSTSRMRSRVRRFRFHCVSSLLTVLLFYSFPALPRLPIPLTHELN
jgi:hypothetical protein